MTPISVRRLARRHNWRVLLALTAAMIAVPAVIQATIGYQLYFNQLMGPHEVSVADIAAFPGLEADNRRWFRIADATLVPLTIYDVTIKKRGDRETGRDTYYYFALAGAKTVLVRSSEQSPSKPYLAEMRRLPDHVRPRFQAHHAALARQAELAPFYLEARAINPQVLQGFMVAFGILPLLFLLAWGLRTLMRLVDWRRTPAVAGLARFKPPLDETIAAIDAELAAGESKTALRKLRLTRSWLFGTKLSAFQILHLNELVWVLPTYQNTYFTVIPVGRQHQLRLWNRYGGMLVANGRKASVQAAGVAIVQRVPWVFAEYTDELNAAFWRRRKGLWERAAKPGGDPATGARRDRAALIKAVDDRREAMLKVAPAAGAA